MCDVTRGPRTATLRSRRRSPRGRPLPRMRAAAARERSRCGGSGRVAAARAAASSSARRCRAASAAVRDLRHARRARAAGSRRPAGRQRGTRRPSSGRCSRSARCGVGDQPGIGRRAARRGAPRRRAARAGGCSAPARAPIRSVRGSPGPTGPTSANDHDGRGAGERHEQRHVELGRDDRAREDDPRPRQRGQSRDPARPALERAARTARCRLRSGAYEHVVRQLAHPLRERGRAREHEVGARREALLGGAEARGVDRARARRCRRRSGRRRARDRARRSATSACGT